MECRVKVNKFCNSDPYISSIMGIEYDENFLLRFGDVTIKNNQFQVTAKDQVTPEMTFDTGKWYHLAVVFTGSQFIVYVDGEVAATKQATRGPLNLYDGGDFNFGYSYNGRYLDGYISEARIWTRVLSQVEIQETCATYSPTQKVCWLTGDSTTEIRRKQKTLQDTGMMPRLRQEVVYNGQKESNVRNHKTDLL